MPNITPAPPSSVSTVPDERTNKPALPGTELVALACLVLTELICFGPIIRKVGFYLDDWSMLSNLHFGPQRFWELIAYSLQDSKVIIRPLEAPYFATLYLAFGDQPLGYHLVNAAFEVAGAWFLYLALARFTGSRPVSLAAALLFLLYPAHDSTHYWYTASSVTISLSLYLMSLWLNIRAVQERSPLQLIASATIFGVSLFNYESFMPLCALNGAAMLFLYLRENPPARALFKAAVACLPLAAAGFLFWVYARIFLPAVGLGWNRTVVTDPGNIFRVVAEGVRLTFSPDAFAFFGQRAQEALAAGLTTANIAGLVALPVLVFAGSALLAADREKLSNAPLLALMGIIVLVCSFTIFGVAAGYMPRLDNIINRINAGGSLGAVLILAALPAAIAAIIPAGKHRRLASAGAITLLSAPLLIFFCLSNWGFSRPWIASWTVQKHIKDVVKRAAGRFQDGDSVILANTPRYVHWSPLFDGVWDFQSMVRFYLDNPRINAGVVSERMELNTSAIKDISSGFLCGTYPYGRLFLLVPIPEHWFQIHSGTDFISAVERHGMGFDLDPGVVAKWRRSLEKL